MTIFLEIAKQFLTSEITSIINTSEGADQSLMNSALGFIGLGRNTDLSTAKRQSAPVCYPQRKLLVVCWMSLCGKL